MLPLALLQQMLILRGKPEEALAVTSGREWKPNYLSARNLDPINLLPDVSTTLDRYQLMLSAVVLSSPREAVNEALVGMARVAHVEFWYQSRTEASVPYGDDFYYIQSMGCEFSVTVNAVQVTLMVQPFMADNRPGSRYAEGLKYLRRLLNETGDPTLQQLAVT